jgi:hypothetical protein
MISVNELTCRSLDFTPDGKHFYVRCWSKLLFFNTAILDVSFHRIMNAYTISSFDNLNYQIAFYNYYDFD